MEQRTLPIAFELGKEIALSRARRAVPRGERMKDRWNIDDGDVGGGWIQNEMKRAFDGASILIVEDDADIRDLLSTLLEIAGYRTTACATAEHGLNALREQTFDFILTDYALPNRTGGGVTAYYGTGPRIIRMID